MTLGKHAIQPNGGVQVHGIFAMKAWWAMRGVGMFYKRIDGVT